MSGDLRTRVGALTARIKREAQLLGGCHPIDKGARRNIGIDADRLAALVLDADPDTPTACSLCESGGRVFHVHPKTAPHPDTPTADAPADTDLRARIGGWSAQDVARNIVNQIGDALWEQLKERGVSAAAMIDARQKTNDTADEFATRLITEHERAQVEAARRDALNEAAARMRIEVDHTVASVRWLRDRAARGETRQP